MITEEERLRRRKHCRKYYHKNREKILGLKHAYYLKNKEIILAKRKIYKEKNKDRINKVDRAYKKRKRAALRSAGIITRPNTRTGKSRDKDYQKEYREQYLKQNRVAIKVSREWKVTLSEARRMIREGFFPP